ncbi:MAG: hypothetical protein AAGI07_07590 [Bacteroidota bacterium]
MIKYRLFASFVSILVVVNSYGQTKYEKESRLKRNNIPLQAKAFIDSLGFDKKVKWYFEESLIGKSIEAKTNFNKEKYSIEFDTAGILQDVEIEIDWHKVPIETQKNISNYLATVFSNYQFIKIQVQFTGKPQDLLQYLKKITIEKTFTTRYEIVVKGKKQGKRDWYEITFSEAGNFESISKIIFRNTDNLEY